MINLDLLQNNTREVVSKLFPGKYWPWTVACWDWVMITQGSDQTSSKVSRRIHLKTRSDVNRLIPYIL